MLCNVPFLSLNFRDYSNDKVNPINRRCNINCWTALEELYNRYIFQQVLTYISANLIVILNLCTLIEILLKVFIRYIRLEIGREYFELAKNNYLLRTWAEISSVVVNVLLQYRYQSQHFIEWAILKKYAIFSNNSKIKSMRFIANSFFHNYLLCLKQISQEMKCMYIKWI